jgi:hypothetical protein
MAADHSASFMISMPADFDVGGIPGDVITRFGPLPMAEVQRLGALPDEELLPSIAGMLPWWEADFAGGFFRGLALRSMWMDLRWCDALDDHELDLIERTLGWASEAERLGAVPPIRQGSKTTSAALRRTRGMTGRAPTPFPSSLCLIHARVTSRRPPRPRMLSTTGRPQLPSIARIRRRTGGATTYPHCGHAMATRAFDDARRSHRDLLQSSRLPSVSERRSECRSRVRGRSFRPTGVCPSRAAQRCRIPTAGVPWRAACRALPKATTAKSAAATQRVQFIATAARKARSEPPPASGLFNIELGANA